jgi:hypothetical protein
MPDSADSLIKQRKIVLEKAGFPLPVKGDREGQAINPTDGFWLPHASHPAIPLF